MNSVVRNVVARYIQAQDFMVGWTFDGTVEDRDGKRSFDSKSHPYPEGRGKPIKNMRQFSDEIKFWFYRPFNMSRNKLQYSVSVKPIAGGFTVIVVWPEIQCKVVKNYYPWFGPEKKPLTPNNLKQLMDLIKGWNMGSHWDYDS